MLFNSETTSNNDFDKNFARLIFADRAKIPSLWTKLFVDLLRNTKFAKYNPRQK